MTGGSYDEHGALVCDHVAHPDSVRRELDRVVPLCSPNTGEAAVVDVGCEQEVEPT